MGLLASGEVEECSASDLVGQYVGQTGPKTKKLFQKALGKVLFIDEAYRLSVGHFAQEAIDELVGLLTHPDFKGKLIVILAGYEKDMKQLMSVNTGLSSRFPDQVVFENLDADQCLKVISKELQKKTIQTDGWDTDESSGVYIQMKELIRDMSELADWGNARDMITVSKEMVNTALISSRHANPSLTPILSGDDALAVMKSILAGRQRRSNIPSKPRRSAPNLPQQTFTPDPAPAPSLGTTTTTNTVPPSRGNDGSTGARGRGAPPNNRGARQGDRGRRGGRGGFGNRPQLSSVNDTASATSPASMEGSSPSNVQDAVPSPPSSQHHNRGGAPRHRGRGNAPQHFPDSPRTPSSPLQSATPTNHIRTPRSQSINHNHNRAGPGGSNAAVQRDPGVSDAMWRQMGAAKRAAAELERNARNQIKEMERKAEEERKEEERQKKIVADLQRAEAAAREASERAEQQRQREEAHRRALAAKAAREKAAAELRARREAERQRQEREARAQQKLREMGVCPVGYQWIKMGSLYRCAGGAHIVSDSQLGL